MEEIMQQFEDALDINQDYGFTELQNLGTQKCNVLIIEDILEHILKNNDFSQLGPKTTKLIENLGQGDNGDMEQENFHSLNRLCETYYNMRYREADILKELQKHVTLGECGENDLGFYYKFDNKIEVYFYTDNLSSVANVIQLLLTNQLCYDPKHVKNLFSCFNFDCLHSSLHNKYTISSAAGVLSRKEIDFRCGFTFTLTSGEVSNFVGGIKELVLEKALYHTGQHSHSCL